MKQIEAGVLNVAYEENGSPKGWPVVLLHGFPYDIHAYDDVVPRLVATGARVIVPYLRGFGPTLFRTADTPRSGEQAALGHDLLALLDALAISRAVVAGHDWGCRAACIVAALWPERVTALVSQNGYNIQNLARAGEPSAPENEFRYWYQYYFHAERGRVGLKRNRHALCKLLWRLWSPTWAFSDAIYKRTAESFDNPDFVDVVIHSYRHRHALAEGDPAVAEIERRLARRPSITVPAITLDGEVDGVMALGGTGGDAAKFTGRHEHRVVPNAGHNLPQEVPDVFAEAIQTVKGWAG